MVNLSHVILRNPNDKVKVGPVHVLLPSPPCAAVVRGLCTSTLRCRLQC